VAEWVYILCFLTSTAVAVLLFRGYARSRHRILFWCGLGFVGLSLNNAMLIIDLMVVPVTLDLSVVRQLPAVVGMGLMLFGMIWDDR
jgi:hypothetical protein